MNLEELTNLLEDTYDYNYLLRNKYDQLLAEYIVEKIGIHSVVRSDGVTFFKGGNEICWLRFKTKGDFDLGGETILEDSFYLHCYSSNAQIGTEAVDILIIIGKIASHLDTIVKMYLETYKRAKQRYDSGKRDTSELRQKINVLKSQLEVVPLKKKKKR